MDVFKSSVIFFIMRQKFDYEIYEGEAGFPPFYDECAPEHSLSEGLSHILIKVGVYACVRETGRLCIAFTKCFFNQNTYFEE